MYTVLKKNILLVFLVFVCFLFILGSCNNSSVDTTQGEESLSSGSGEDSTEPEETEDSDEANENVNQNENNGRNDEGNVDANDSGNEEENDVQNKNDSSAGNTYVSEKFDFTIDLPEDWVDIVEINTTPFSSELDGAVNFIYAPTDTTIEQMVFSILVVSGSVAEEQEENPFWVSIGTHKGYTFGYITPGEPVPELLEPENSDKLEYVQDMLYIDLPEIMETFRFGES